MTNPHLPLTPLEPSQRVFPLGPSQDMRNTVGYIDIGKHGTTTPAIHCSKHVRLQSLLQHRMSFVQ